MIEMMLCAGERPGTEREGGTVCFVERPARICPFAFILGPDPTYAVIEDGQWLNDTLPYGTIHRLASAGKRKGVAADVITWCLEHCESLRADTHADNKAMQHILEETGFTRCGVIHVADGSPRFAYQRMSLTMPLEH